MKHKYLYWIIIISFVSSCNFTGKLTRRYKEIIPNDIKENISKYVNIDAYSIEKEKSDPPKPKTLFDLTPPGQKALINQAGFNEDLNDKLMSALASSLSPKSTSNVEWLDYTKVEKRVIVSIKNLQHWPADRISKVSIKLKFDDEIKLLSCNKLITEYQNIDLGKLNYSNSNQFEIGANATTGLTVVNSNSGLSEETSSQTNSNTVDKSNSGNSSGNKTSNSKSNSNTGTGSQGLTSKFSASRSFAEEVLLKQRIVALNASISKNTLTLYQESISGIDLTGNIIADLVFESKDDINVVKVYSFSDLSIKDGVNIPSKIGIKEILVSFFNFDKSIEAEISYDADYRHVKSGDRTISESDDNIELLYGTAKNSETVVLIPKNQLRPKLWILHLKDDKSRMPLKIKSPSAGGSGELIFNSYTEAKEFITWLKIKKAEVIAAKGVLGSIGHVIFTPLDKQIDENTIDNLVIGAEGVSPEEKKETKLPKADK